MLLSFVLYHDSHLRSRGNFLLILGIILGFRACQGGQFAGAGALDSPQLGSAHLLRARIYDKKTKYMDKQKFPEGADARLGAGD